jgi:polyisoprenoid-binding protein YceI
MTTASSRAADPLAGPAAWQLDPAGSTATFRHKTIWGLVTVRGSFSAIRGGGEIHADGSASGRLEIDAASVDTGNAKRDTHLRSADFFHAAAHPQLVATISPVARTDDGAATVAGTLTVNGVSRPIQLDAKITEATGQAVTLQAEIEIDRGDYGMTWNQLGMLRGNAAVSVVARFVRPAPDGGSDGGQAAR